MPILPTQAPAPASWQAADAGAPPRSAAAGRNAVAPAASGAPENAAHAVLAALERLNAHAGTLEFRLDPDSGRALVRVIDPETRTVIRQFPSEEAIAISRSLERMQGLLVRLKA